MQLVALLSWWYGGGIRRTLGQIRLRFASLLDYFSIDLLLRTLFSPFRQISAGSVDGPIGVKIRAWADRMVSRTIGAIVRTIVILVGCVAITVQALLSLAYFIVWLVLPAVPVIGLVMMLTGWIPWTLKL